MILDLAQAEPPTFANFVAGANGEAAAALRALAGGSFEHAGVLVWGTAGGGKSHLLAAAAAAALAAGRHVAACPGASDLPAADRLRPGMLVVVDDVDAADAQAQARFFTVINALAPVRGQWAAAAHVPPARLTLRDDLRTRLAQGLVLEVVPLADADKAEALASYARERGFRLGDDVIVYLLAHGRRDMKSLVATLAALDRRSLAEKRNVTVPLLREWLRSAGGVR